MIATRRTALRCVGTAPALLLQGSQNAEERPPNILFIYTDDQARWGVRAYGNRDVHSPNTDRIASEGALFEQAFVTTPVCSPARAAMMTSQPSFRTGIRDFIDRRREPDLGLSENFPLWPQILQQRGYRTALFGKWHLGSRPEHHPTKRGYHEFLGFLDGGNVPMDPWLEIDGKEQQIRGSLPDLLTDGAIAFLRKNRQQPFLASVHYRAPHSPYGPVPPEDTAAVADRKPEPANVKGLPREQASKQLLAYYGSIASVDRNVGRLLQSLESLDLVNNTIVLFTSDNGYMIGQHGAHGKGNATSMVPGEDRVSNMFDDSILVPMLMRWPGKIKPATRIREMVTHLDIFPTMLKLTGSESFAPDGYQPCGRDFSPLLSGTSVRWRQTVYGDFDMYHYRDDSMRMIRTAEWKLVTHSHNNVSHELYDLKADPGETRNLIGSYAHSAKRSELRERLWAWQQWMGDPRRRGPREEF